MYQQPVFFAADPCAFTGDLGSAGYLLFVKVGAILGGASPRRRGSGGGEIAALSLHHDQGSICCILDRHQCADSTCRVQPGRVGSHSAGALQICQAQYPLSSELLAAES